MSIRPIDMQTLLPKLQSMKFAKELEINKHNNDMIAADKEMKKFSEEKANQVIKADRKETDKLRNDNSSKEKNSKNNRKEKKAKEKKETKKKKIIKNKGNRFDMKV